MNYYQFHIADFALHTSHLTLEEEAVFRRLLDYYYDTESPIPEETGSVIRRLRLGSYAETVASILDEFFVLQADGWHNLRADSEISLYNAKAERARENGKNGGRPKKTKELKDGKTKQVISGNPEESGSKANQEPETKNQEPRTKKSKPPSGGKRKTIAYTDEFEAAWAVYPKRDGSNSKANAFEQWNIRLSEGVDAKAMTQGTWRYLEHCRAKGKLETEYVMQGQRFYGKAREFENEWSVNHGQNFGHSPQGRPSGGGVAASEAAIDAAFGGASRTLEGSFERVDAHETPGGGYS